MKLRVACKDGTTREIERPESAGLRAGESFRGFYSVDVADPNIPCAIALDANGQTIQAFCASGGTATPGPCP